MATHRELLFALFFSLIIAIAIGAVGLGGIGMKHIVLLFSAVVIIAAVKPLFNDLNLGQEEKFDSTIIVGALGAAFLVSMLVNNSIYAKMVVSPLTVIFILLMALFVLLIELRGKLFTGDSTGDNSGIRA